MKETTTIRPLGDRVLLRVEDPPKQSKGGIVLPDSTKERPTKGKVLAVGPGRRNDTGEVSPVGVEVGQLVLFSRYTGTSVDGDDTLLLVNEVEILAVVQ